MAKLAGHTGRITDMVFLPGGDRLLTASEDKTVGQWDVSTGRENSVAGAESPRCGDVDGAWAAWRIGDDQLRRRARCGDKRMRRPSLRGLLVRLATRPVMLPSHRMAEGFWQFHSAIERCGSGNFRRSKYSPGWTAGLTSRGRPATSGRLRFRRTAGELLAHGGRLPHHRLSGYQQAQPECVQPSAPTEKWPRCSSRRDAGARLLTGSWDGSARLHVGCRDRAVATQVAERSVRESRRVLPRMASCSC